jgi:hypothetical protein
MTEQREVLQKRIEAEHQYAKDALDIQFKGVGYLLAANAAGLAGCMALLKDYSTVPQLKGIGIFIWLFGMGFIFAIIGFLGTVLHHQGWMGSFLGYNDKGGARPNLYVIAAVAPIVISCLLLSGAILIMVAKFMWLGASTRFASAVDPGKPIIPQRVAWPDLPTNR